MAQSMQVGSANLQRNTITTRRRFDPSLLNYATIAVALGAILYGLNQAIAHAWVSDDAFISFRYAKNLVSGLGLVFNAGERMEGYSNFLWTLLIAGGMKIGIDPVVFAKVGGITSFIVTALALGFYSWRRRAGSTNLTLYVPFAALAFVVTRDIWVYATGGLETAFVTMLVTCAVVTLLDGNTIKHRILGGLFLALAAMTRVDVLVIAGGVTLCVLYCDWKQHRRFNRNSFSLVAPLLVFLVPYWIWRISYYGYPLPNTFYAKSVTMNNWSQGLFFVWIFLKTYWMAFIALSGVLAVAILLRLRQSRYENGMVGKSAKLNPQLLLLCALFPYLVSVIKVGGGYMFARLLIPIFPLALLLAENSLRSIRINPLVKYVLAPGLAALFLIRAPQVEGFAHVRGISDEVNYYPDSRLQQERKLGEFIAPYLESSGASLAFYGGKCMFMYYANPDRAIEAETGLTDTVIAHQELEERGRPGHEKPASLEYLRKSGYDLAAKVTDVFPTIEDKLFRLSIGETKFRILRYDNAVMDALAALPEVTFTKFPEYLDGYLARIEQIPLDQLLKEYDEYCGYYFDHNDDQFHESQMTEEIQRRLNRSRYSPNLHTAQPITP